MRRAVARPPRWLAPIAIATGVSLGAPASRAQRLADPPAASIVGTACVDLDEDARCGPADLPLAGASVRTSTGLAAHTDASGRFHIAAAGGEHALERADGAPMPSALRVGLSLDAHALGPTARAPAMVAVPLPPGAVVSVDLAARLPERDATRPLALDRAASRVQVDGARLVLDVPIVSAPRHVVSASDAPVPLDAAGRGALRIALDGREARVTLVDRAPDGRAQLWSVRVLRVPRDDGGDRVVVEEPRALATLELPPADAAVAPGRLLVPIRAAPGTPVKLRGRTFTIPPSGVAFAWVDVDGAPLDVESDDARHAFALPVSAWSGASARVFGDLRLGAAGLVPFAQGHIDAQLRAPTPGGAAAAGVVLDDDAIAAAADGRFLLQSGRAGAFGRFPDPERELAVWGDSSRAAHDNPAQLSVWARVTSELGDAALGPARTPLDDSEVGRLERPALGPSLDVEVPLGPVVVGVEAAVDASAAPFVSVVPVASAHVEIESTGGRVLWLAHRRVAPASERVVVATVDALTGLVVDRRQLVRGADYDIDYASGRVTLAAPLGLVPVGDVGLVRPGASGAGAQTRVVVDYAHEVTDAQQTPSGAARISARAGGVEGGVSGALAEDASLLVLDATARPHELVALSASAARAGGDWTHGGAVGARSLDGGLSFSPTRTRATPGGPGGDAAALRLTLGDEARHLAAWGAWRDAGFTDGLGGAPLDDARGGASGHLDLFETVDLSGVAEARTGADPQASALAALTTLDAATRAQLTLGPVRVAVDTLERHATRDGGGARTEGAAVGVGGEIGVRPLADLEVYAGHLHGVWRDGAGPGARDPTFSYAGAHVALDDSHRLAARLGVHPDLRPQGHIQLAVDDEDGGVRYGGFGVSSDDPWTGRSLVSVSGARRAFGPRADVFAEQRVSSTDAGVLAGRAAGGDAALGHTALGPLTLGLGWENSERVVDAPRTLRNAVTARAGLQGTRASVHAFGELSRVQQDGVRAAGQWALGVVGRATPSRALTLGARALAGEGTPLDGTAARPFGELLVGAALRAHGLPAAFAQYSLRADRRVADGRRERLHLLRGSVAAGALPHLTVIAAATLAQDEAFGERDADAFVTQAALASVRAEVPVGWLVPAVELGARVITGAGLDAELAGTARAELALSLGPAAIGAGVVLAGYTGTGLEPLSLLPSPPPVYLVLRGAFG